MRLVHDHNYKEAGLNFKLFDDQGKIIRKITSNTHFDSLQDNRDARAEFNKNDAAFRKSVMRRVASIPLTVIEQMLTGSIFPSNMLGSKGFKNIGELSLYFRTPEFKKWLNSPENKHLKTVDNYTV